MAPRVSSDLLLAGSLPATPTEEAFRASAELFGHLVFALPDGETGPRAGWVGDERERLLRPNPGIATVQETLSATGVPRHAYETPRSSRSGPASQAALGLLAPSRTVPSKTSSRTQPAHRSDPGRRARDPVGCPLRGSRYRGGGCLDRARCLGTLHRNG